MNKNVLEVLKCIKCGHKLISINDEYLSCSNCNVRYPTRKGTPIMFFSKKDTGDTNYELSSLPLSHPDNKFRIGLRKLKIEGFARKLWSFYCNLTAKIVPKSPHSPDFWLKKIKSAIPVGQKKILDFGGGEAPYKKYLSDNNDLYIVLEVDIDSHFVNKRLNEHLYVIGDGHDDMFCDNSFDLILMFEVLEHLRNPFTIIENCSRWLRPNGLLVISVPQYWHIHGWPNDYFRYTISGVKHLGKINGLELIDYWAMGGPCILILCVITLNFHNIFTLPIIKQIIYYPLLIMARLFDATFFRNNLHRQHPDTRGWVAIIKKTNMALVKDD